MGGEQKNFRLNSFSHPLTLDEPQPGEADKKITRLENSHYYFLECVCIICDQDRYRLVVLHRKRTLTDRTYLSLKAAKTAFSHIYRTRAWSFEIENNWSRLYFPEHQWLEQMMWTEAPAV